MKNETVKRKRGFPKYTYIGCPLTRHYTPWCYRLCTPTKCGRGFCGRIAPHGMLDRVQQSVLKQLKEKE